MLISSFDCKNWTTLITFCSCSFWVGPSKSTAEISTGTYFKWSSISLSTRCTCKASTCLLPFVLLIQFEYWLIGWFSFDKSAGYLYIRAGNSMKLDYALTDFLRFHPVGNHYFYLIILFIILNLLFQAILKE